MPNARAIGVIRLIGRSAYRIAALAPLRLPQILEGTDCPTRGDCHFANERAKRCGSSDYAAAAESVEDQAFEGGVGVDGDVAKAVAGAEGLDGAAPLGQALAVQADRIVVQRDGDGGAAFAIDQAHITTEGRPQLLRRQGV